MKESVRNREKNKPVIGTKYSKVSVLVFSLQQTFTLDTLKSKTNPPPEFIKY